MNAYKLQWRDTAIIATMCERPIKELSCMENSTVCKQDKGTLHTEQNEVTESQIIALENTSLRVQVKLLASDKALLHAQLRALAGQLDRHNIRETQHTAAPVLMRNSESKWPGAVAFCASFAAGLALGFFVVAPMVCELEGNKNPGACKLIYSQSMV